MNGQFLDYEFTDDPLGAVSYAGTNLTSRFRPDITSWAELAAVATYGATLPVMLEWYDESVPVLRSVVLRLGSDATDTANGVQRPNDYTTAVWYQTGPAG